MQGRSDAANFIKSFTGSHHFVLDYLVEEVLQRQPEHVRNFLLQTAILDRLSSPLCDAVTEQEDGRGMLEALRAYRSLALGDVPGTVKYARQALELTPEDDQVRHIQAISLLGLAQYTSGDLEAAERSLADFHTNLRKTGEILTLISITFLLADIRVALGRLHEAESNYQQSLRLATGQGEPMPLGTADLYRGPRFLIIRRTSSVRILQRSIAYG